jgi:ABC-2 type transport system permease protein
MLSNVLLKSILDQRRSLFWWVVGLGGLNIVTLLFYPSFADRPELNDILKDSGAFVEALVGQIEDFTSPEGFVDSQLFSFMIPLLFVAFGIFGGSGAIAAEEERGTLDLLLSNPLDRWRIVLEKFGANMAAMALLGIGTWVGLVIGALIVSMDISYVRLAEATLSAALLGAVFGTFALAVGSARGKRGSAAGIAAAVCVGTYLLNTLAPLVDQLASFTRVSPFHYYNSGMPLFNGLDPVHGFVLLALTSALVAIAIVTFERRDLGIG